MALVVNHSLKFPYSFSFDFKDKPMFHCGQGNEVGGFIVILNPIEVMYNPIFRQWFFVRFFPYIYVFQHISTNSSTGVAGFANLNVSIASIKSPPFPIASLFPNTIWDMLSTMERPFGDKFATSKAGMMVSFLFQIIFPLVFFIITRHTLIISQGTKIVNIHEEIG